MSDGPFDLAVIGGGIVGLATAWRWVETYPESRVVLLEKEPEVAAHQSGHNSGVIHSGLYYRPGSSKARNCVRGAEQMRAFCTEHGIPFETCGKVVVATDDDELPRLEELHRRGVANGVSGVRLIGPEELREIEPASRGIRALWVPSAGIVDYAVVCRKLFELLETSSCTVRFGQRVTAMRRESGGVVLETPRGAVRAAHVIGCAGLHSDRVARADGSRPDLRIVPFRGEYYELVPERRELVRGLIYPVPDPRFPFLGVHFTRCIDGSVEAGPNAVLAFAREGYRKSRISPRDLAETLAWPGFRKLAMRHWRMGLGEMARSFSKQAFVRALSRLVPEIRSADLRRGGAGVRAQALWRSGELVDDFVIDERSGALHVLNAPSPAATASLAIADEILTRARAAFSLAGGRDAPR